MDNTYGTKGNDGAYALTEQGDLGLGLTPIEEGKDINHNTGENEEPAKLI